jgi:hypothetical protein
MAQYKYGNQLSHVNNDAFDTLHHPGATAPFSGIYKCAGCGIEAVSAHGHSLPPQNHHQHEPNLGPIRWRLLVASSHR